MRLNPQTQAPGCRMSHTQEVSSLQSLIINEKNTQYFYTFESFHVNLQALEYSCELAQLGHFKILIVIIDINNVLMESIHKHIKVSISIYIGPGKKTFNSIKCDFHMN